MQAKSAKQLAFSMQPPVQTQWNWAAIAVSISSYYRGASNFYTQCNLANWAFGVTSCCMDGASHECNRTFSLSSALQHSGHLASQVPGAVTLPQIIAEIDAYRPVCVVLQWLSGGSSNVVITGYDDSGTTPSILVNDHVGGISRIPFASFPGLYRTGASWVSTCLTTP